MNLHRCSGGCNLKNVDDVSPRSFYGKCSATECIPSSLQFSEKNKSVFIGIYPADQVVYVIALHIHTEKPANNSLFFYVVDIHNKVLLYLFSNRIGFILIYALGRTKSHKLLLSDFVDYVSK